MVVQRAAEVLSIRNQLGTSFPSLFYVSSHLISPCVDLLWAESKQRHVEELKVKYNAAAAAKDEEIAVLTLSRNTIFTKLSERDAQITTQTKDMAGLSVRLEQAAHAVGNRHAVRSELGTTYDTFFRVYNVISSLRPIPISSIVRDNN